MALVRMKIQLVVTLTVSDPLRCSQMHFILMPDVMLLSVLCSARSSGGGPAEVPQGAAGGPAEGPAAGAEGGGAGGEERRRGGGARAADQTHGGEVLLK